MQPSAETSIRSQAVPSTSSQLPTLEGEQSQLSKIEVEYALILSQMIEIAQTDPSQLRLSIYEFARAKLNYNTLGAKKSERERLSVALEAAIGGVENFSRRRDEWRRPEALDAKVALPYPHAQPRRVPLENTRNASGDSMSPRRDRFRSLRPILDLAKHAKSIDLARASVPVGLVLFTLMAGFVLGSTVLSSPRGELRLTGGALPAVRPISNAKNGVNVPGDSTIKSVPENPTPTDFGVYAMSGSNLLELQPLAGQVPDSRVYMSAPISQPSQTQLPDGFAKFVVYRRDLAGDAADRFEARAVARVARVMSFDPQGKPKAAAAPASWVIRNVTYNFKARPMAGNPEMLLVQLRDSDAPLPAGRYILTLKDKGYDFTVAGTPLDPAQCVERTDALNGSFYSDCPAQ